MTPEQRIKREILLGAIKENDDLKWDGEINESNIDEAYDKVLVENDAHWDYESEFRCSGEPTELDCEWSRHYEADAVARKLSDGSWVGWNYWHGGGKHGEPEAIDWMCHAYELDVTEEEKLTIVKTFKKREPAAVAG